MLTTRVYKKRCYENILLSGRDRVPRNIMWTNNYSIDMKFLLCMMVVTLSNAGRIPRSSDTNTHRDFPNLQTVHHGHGATSYQNVQIQNHGKISIPTKSHSTSHHYLYPEHQDYELEYEVSSVTEVPYLIDDVSNENRYFLSEDVAEPYNTSNDNEHIDIKNIAQPPTYYDQYEQEYDYGYHD